MKDTSGQFRLTGSSTNAAKDAGNVAKTVVVSGSASMIAAAIPVLAAVAASSTIVPVIGWVGAVVTSAIAGLLAAVESVLTATIKRKEAILWAAQLGLPNAEDFPKFVVDVAHMGFTQRYALGADLTRRLADERDPEKRKVLDSQRRIVGILLIREWLAAHPSVVKRLATPANPNPVVPPPIASPVVLAATYSPWTPWLVSGTLLAAVAIAAFA